MNIDNDPATYIRDLLTDLVRGVVTKPEEVKISHQLVGSLLAFSIRVNQEDVRRIIGQKGKRFKAFEAIASHLAKAINRECHLVVEEDPEDTSRLAQHRAPFRQRRDEVQMKELLQKTAAMFAKNASDVTVSETVLGPSIIFEIKANAVSYPMIYGPNAMFDYGPDGAVIGSIKNIFDGIAKNHGKVVRITLSKP